MIPSLLCTRIHKHLRKTLLEFESVFSAYWRVRRAYSTTLLSINSTTTIEVVYEYEHRRRVVVRGFSIAGCVWIWAQTESGGGERVIYRWLFMNTSTDGEWWWEVCYRWLVLNTSTDGEWWWEVFFYRWLFMNTSTDGEWWWEGYLSLAGICCCAPEFCSHANKFHTICGARAGLAGSCLPETLILDEIYCMFFHIFMFHSFYWQIFKLSDFTNCLLLVCPRCCKNENTYFTHLAEQVFF